MILFYFDYPKVKHSLGEAALEDPYPAWLLDTLGVIRAANLMAFWLWDTLKPGEPVRRDALLGTSALNVFANNFERIPVEQNGEFYAKKSAVARRMNAEMGSSLCTSFITAMKSDPRLAQIYGQATPYIDREWEHTLRIIPPGLSGSDDTRLLEFQVTLFRLEGNSGFLCTYTPNRATLPAIEEQHSLLIDQYGDKGYVQTGDMGQDNVESSQQPTSVQGDYREYYPAIIQDPLWYIIGENKAHRLLTGDSVVGMHFFELFFAPQLHQWLGPVQETSAPRAIKYFDVFTVRYLREDHELHARYEQVMKYLLQIQDFRNVLEISRKLPIRIYIPDDPEDSFYTCRVILPWPFSPEIALQFRAMVRFIYGNALVHADIRDYKETLVPENSETEVALILLYLASTTPARDEGDADDTAFQQFLWLLAVMRVVKEGLSRKDGEDSRWEPESAFGRIRYELDEQFDKSTEDAIDRAITELREIIGTLDNRGIVGRRLLLAMLHSLTATKDNLELLSKFLSQELEAGEDTGYRDEAEGGELAG